MRKLNMLVLACLAMSTGLTSFGQEGGEQKNKPKAAKAEKRARQAKKQPKLSPEQVAKIREQLTARLKSTVAVAERQTGMIQAKLNRLQALSTEQTITIPGPRMEVVQALSGRHGKGRGFRALRGRFRGRKGKAGEVRENPLAVQAQNNDELKAAAAEAAQAYERFLETLTRQKEQMTSALQSAAGEEEGTDARQVLGKLRTAFGGPIRKEVAEAQAAAAKAERKVAILETQLWLNGISQKVNTDAGKAGAQSASAAFQKYLELRAQLAELQDKIAKEGETFKASLKAVYSELAPAPQKREKRKRGERGAKRQEKGKKGAKRKAAGTEDPSK